MKIRRSCNEGVKVGRRKRAGGRAGFCPLLPSLSLSTLTSTQLLNLSSLPPTSRRYIRLSSYDSLTTSSPTQTHTPSKPNLSTMRFLSLLAASLSLVSVASAQLFTSTLPCKLIPHLLRPLYFLLILTDSFLFYLSLVGDEGNTVRPAPTSRLESSRSPSLPPSSSSLHLSLSFSLSSTAPRLCYC